MRGVESRLWKRARDVFDEAVELPHGARSGYLARACAGEPEIRGAVERLLEADVAQDARLGDSAVVNVLEDALDKDLDRSLGAYRLLCRIGSGGMGTVYLAESTGRPRRRLAVKLLRPGLVHPESLRRFRLECRVLASLEHPNITRLVDDGVTDQGRPYLVMEWVDGEPITSYCDRRRMGAMPRLELVYKVAGALQHAHDKLLVHRDIKPSNVLVTAEGRVRLLDFGIVKVLEGSPFGADESTAALSLPLTLGYASPEQIAGERVATSSDVYSLAVLTYELMVGQAPFDWTDRSLPDVHRLHATEAPPRLTATFDALEPPARSALCASRDATAEQLRRFFKGDLQQVLRQALDRDPARRYASARQFADDLRRVVQGRPVHARLANTIDRLRRFFDAVVGHRRSRGR